MEGNKLSNEWTDRDVIRIVNLNHETKRNLEALEREANRRLKKKSQRYVSRAEKQIVGFMIGGFAANVLAFLGLAISCHYE